MARRPGPFIKSHERSQRAMTKDEVGKKLNALQTKVVEFLDVMHGAGHSVTFSPAGNTLCVVVSAEDVFISVGMTHDALKEQ
jgi:hypothetical protein